MKFLILILLSLFLVIACDNEEKTTTKCDPACDEWKTCNVDKCELTEGRCIENSDCKDSEKPTCDENHKCIKDEVVECNPTCDATWQECNNGVCETLADKCAEDSDCKDSEKPACENHECVAEDTRCGDNDSCPEGRHCEFKEGVGDVCKYNKPENTYTRCTDGYDNDQNGHTDCDDWGCQALDVCKSKCEDVECTGGKVCDPDTGDCINVELQTIKQVRDAHQDGTIYKTKGIVVAGDKDGVYIQDSSDRGIYVYINPGSGEYIGQVIGDEITVSGVFKDYLGLAELTFPEITNVTHDHALPDFKLVDAANVDNLENYESMLVKFENDPFLVTLANQSGGPNSFVKDSNDKEFIIRTDIYPFEIVDGDILTKVQGVLKYTKDKFRLLPRNESDIILLPFTCTPACNASSEVCVRDHDSVGKCETSCTPACNDTYETCVVDAGESSCQLIEGMCYINNDDETIGCGAHEYCLNNQCMESVNIVTNGDLESWVGDPEEAEGYTTEYENQAKTKIYKETNASLVCEGATSAKIRKTDSEQNTSNKKNEFYSPAFPIDTNKQYNLSVQIIDNDPNVKVRMFWKFYDINDYAVDPNTRHMLADSVNFDGCKTYKKADSWDTFAGLDADEKAQVKTMRIGVRLLDEDSGDEGFIYVDDFRVEEVR